MSHHSKRSFETVGSKLRLRVSRNWQAEMRGAMPTSFRWACRPSMPTLKGVGMAPKFPGLFSSLNSGTPSVADCELLRWQGVPKMDPTTNQLYRGYVGAMQFLV